MQIPRRTVVKGIAAGLPLAAILADPMLARAVADTLEMVTITTKGGRKVSAALALPAKTRAPTVLLVHENRGLTDYLKSMAAELAKEGYVALAIDLFNGKVATNNDEAAALMKAFDPNAATDTLASWIDWLKNNPKGDGKVATIGWCFGGGWSLNASLARPVDATVVYYGDVRKTAAELAPLEGPVLLHWGTQDQWINAQMVKGFEAEAKKAGKSVTAYSYVANHAFANPSGASYHKADAQLAWKRTLAFLKKYDT